MTDNKKTILSYSLFGSEKRFWGTIPFVLMANSLFYPKFVMRFHLDTSARDNSMFKLLDEISKTCSNVEIKVIDTPYTGTLPTIWRMMPLWDEDVSYLFCRDLDAVPSSFEKKVVEFFVKNKQFLIYSMRVYALHTTPLMAGLCGFNCNSLRLYRMRGANNSSFLPSTFENYISRQRNFGWGCDQVLLKNVFCNRSYIGSLIMKRTLDVPIRTAPKKIPGYLPSVMTEHAFNSVNNTLNSVNKDMLSWCDEIVNKFGFEAHPATEIDRSYLIKALDIDCEMCKNLKIIFGKYPDLREFYGI